MLPHQLNLLKIMPTHQFQPQNSKKYLKFLGSIGFSMVGMELISCIALTVL
jgi:hypothetical protein